MLNFRPTGDTIYIIPLQLTMLQAMFRTYLRQQILNEEIKLTDHNIDNISVKKALFVDFLNKKYIISLTTIFRNVTRRLLTLLLSRSCQKEIFNTILLNNMQFIKLNHPKNKLREIKFVDIPL